MKRKTASSLSSSPPVSVPAGPPDPFRLGWRLAPKSDRNGRGERDYIPLTAEDLLHPQEFDQTVENTIQCRDRTYIYDVLQLQVGPRPGFLVLSDCGIDWGVPGVRNHAPDICVMEGVANPERDWGIFSVAAEGAEPVLVVEIVLVDAHDPDVRNNDVMKKVREYFRAGVPLYAIVDQVRENAQRELIGYRRGKRRYVRLPLDEQGRLLLAPVGLLLGLRDNRVVCFHADTGEEIPTMTGMAQAHQQAEQARQQAEQARDAEVQARHQAEAALAAARSRLRELEAQQARPRRPRRPPRRGQ